MTARGHERPEPVVRGSGACPLCSDSDPTTAWDQSAAPCQKRTKIVCAARRRYVPGRDIDNLTVVTGGRFSDSREPACRITPEVGRISSCGYQSSLVSTGVLRRKALSSRGSSTARRDRKHIRRRFIKRCVAPMRIFSVAKGCSTVPRRWRIACGFSSSRLCAASRYGQH
jgi:hypothetical protein